MPHLPPGAVSSTTLTSDLGSASGRFGLWKGSFLHRRGLRLQGQEAWV